MDKGPKRRLTPPAAPKKNAGSSPQNLSKKKIEQKQKLKVLAKKAMLKKAAKSFLSRVASNLKTEKPTALNTSISTLLKSKASMTPQQKEALKKQLATMKTMPISSLRSWAFRNYDKTKKADYTPMMQQFLDLNQGEPPTFTVNFQKFDRFESSVGLGHILPPTAHHVQVTDRQGNVRVGTRGIKKGRIGYFDRNGDYISVFTGYKVKLIRSFKEDSKEVTQQLALENQFHKDLVRHGKEQGHTSVDDMVKTNNVLKKDWDQIQQILSKNEIKLHSDSLYFGGNALKALNGKGHQLLTDSKTLTLIKHFAKGKALNGVKLARGYALRIQDLQTFHRLAQKPHQLQKLLQKAKKPVDANNLLGLFAYQHGALDLRYASKHPRFQGTARNGRTVRTPSYIANVHHRNVPALNIQGRRDLLIANLRALQGGGVTFPGVNGRYRLRDRLPNYWCARTVSGLLGMKKLEAGCTRFFARLAKGGGKVVTDYSKLQSGDIMFFRGTYGNLWHTPCHIGIVVRRGGKKWVMHQGSGKIVYSALNRNYYKKHFYAGIRQFKTPLPDINA